ncbi:MAG: glycosyltransferase family 4 protein [Fibrobacteria bacterium]|nr:glycosyltransferase family 4 protein [Fibrobacteria bacterium]
MIAIVYPQFYGVQGIARYLDSFLENLPDGHPPIYLITGNEEKLARHYPGVEILEIPLPSGRGGLLSWALKARKLLLELYSEGKIKYQNFHWPPLVSGLMLPKSIPLVLTCHTTYLGMTGEFYPERHFTSQWGKTSSRVRKRMEKRILNHSAKVIVLTEQGRQEVLRYGYQGPISIIPNGADIRKFKPDGSISKDVDVIFSGRIEKRKGSRSVGSVCRELVKLKPDVRIVIVGYGDDDEFVKSDVADLAGNVTLTGKVPFQEMMGYYNRARVYASTSYYEGLPGTCLEAMAMELPAVVWDFDFYKGLVEPSISGAVAKPNDFSAMAKRICEILQDDALREKMGQRSRVILETDYNWSGLAKKILGEFNV